MIEVANEQREAALQQTTPTLSRKILANFPDLVAHQGPRIGHPATYYTDPEVSGAICATAEEAMLLHTLVHWCQPVLAVEIGSYVGWTAAHMAAAFAHGGRLVCVDDLSECKQPDFQLMRFTGNLARCGYTNRVQLVVGKSPQALSQVVGDYIDFAHVDGCHQHEQPLMDVQALVDRMAPDGVIALRDTWMPHVADACHWLMLKGWVQTTYPTPARLAFFYKQMPSWWPTFVENASV
jgi:predicted O-methyltransferase YrrM